MVSSKDVARLAGVSQPTVSRVLNSPDSVKPDKRLKVQRAMEELGYYPNLIARSLVTKRTRTIALVSGSLRNNYFVETTDEIIRFNKSRGYKTIVYFEDDNGAPDFFDSVMGQKVDGLLLSLIRLDDPLTGKIAKAKLPCVFFNRVPREGGHCVVADNEASTRMIAGHLLALGHKNIAYISGETDVSTFHERRNGFMGALREAGIEPRAEYLHFTRATADEQVADCTARLLALPDRPTAILCATDTMALACMNTILRQGLRIPDDISLAGIDDIRLAGHAAMQLTTIGYAGNTMAVRAADLLLELIERSPAAGQSPRLITLQPQLIVRRSTGRPGN